MAGEKKLVAGLEVKNGSSVQNIEAVTTALAKSGEAGVKAAPQITSAMEGIEKAAESALRKTADGSQVSDAELQKLAARYVAFEATVTKAWGSIAAAPSEVQTALQTSENQIVGVNAAVAQMGDSAKATADRFAKMAKEASDATKKVETGAQGAAAAQKQLDAAATEAGAKLVRVMNNAKDAETNLEEAIEKGSPRMASQLTRLRNVYTVLTEEIKTAEAQGRTLPAATIAEYQRLGKVIDEQIPKIRRLTDEMAEQKAEIKEGGEQWLGLGDAINKSLGPMGQVQARAGLVGAALKEGWNIGSQAAEKMGADTSLLSNELGDLAQTLGGAIRSRFEAMAESAEEAEKELRKVDIARGLLVANIPNTTQALKAYEIAIDAGIKVTGDFEKELDQVGVVQTKYDELTKLGRVGHILWADAVKRANGDLTAFVANLNATQPIVRAYHEALARATKVVETHIEQLKNQLEAQKNIIKSHDDEIVKIDQVVEKITGHDSALRRLHDSLVAELDILAKFEVAQNGSTESIRDAADNVIKIARAYGEDSAATADLIKHLDSLKASTLGASDETKRHIAAANAASTALQQLVQENEALRQEQIRLTSTMETQSKAGQEAYDATVRKIAANNLQIDVNKRLIESEVQEVAHVQQLSAALDEHAKHVVFVRDETGKVTIANREGAAAAGLAAQGNEAVAKASQDSFEEMQKQVASGKSWNEVMQASADKLNAEAAAAKSAQDATSPFAQVFAEIAKHAKDTVENIEPVRKKVVDLETQLQKMQQTAASETEKMAEDFLKMANKIGGAVDKIEGHMQRLDAATKKAAGDSSSQQSNVEKNTRNAAANGYGAGGV